MARFLGIGVQTDILVTVPVGTAPRRVAFFRPDDLLACTAVLSPTEPESLTVTIPRDDARADEVTIGRVLRVAFEGGTDDTEWDIVTLDDTSADNILTVTALPIAMRLARVVYMGAVTGTGAADPTWTAVQLTATEWLNTLVIPQLASAGMAFELGTVDNTTSRFTMDGDWSSLLEIVNAIAEPGRATAEFRLRRDAGADYGYVLDLLDTIGGTADTVRVRTAVNLIETKRNRSLVEVATRLHARASSDSVATRTMQDNTWRVATVVDGTTLELDDPFGGADAILYDDQCNGMYLAPIALGTPTFASVLVSDSVASTQRVTVSSTATFTAGDWCRFFAAATANGARVTSLTHPTLVDHATDGGYGDRAQVLDRPAIIGDTNLIRNAMLRTWTVAADPPDDWAEFTEVATNVTFTQDLADGPGDGIASFEVALAAGAGNEVHGEYVGGTDPNAVQSPAIYIDSPAAQPWDTAGRTYTATAWIKVTAAPAGGQLWLYLHDADRAGAPAWDYDEDAGLIGVWVEGTDDENVWIRYESPAFDLNNVNPGGTSAAMTGRVRVRMEIGSSDANVTTNPAGAWGGEFNIATNYLVTTYVTYNGGMYYSSTVPTVGDTPPGTDWTNITSGRRADPGWTVKMSAVTLAESPTAIADREGSGGTELWQAVNAVLPTRSSPVKGYDLAVADLAADDAATYATLAFTPGGTVEVTDTDLGIVTPLRLVEYTRDYLRPIASVIRVGQPADLLTKLAESGRLVTTLGR